MLKLYANTFRKQSVELKSNKAPQRGLHCKENDLYYGLILGGQDLMGGDGDEKWTTTA